MKLTKQSMTFFFAFVFFFFFVFQSIVYVLPDNPLKSYSIFNNHFMYKTFPQGWGFYSKNPRDMTFQIINLGNEGTEIYWPNNRVENLFGLNRKGRAQGIEGGRIFSQIKQSDWISTNEDPMESIKNASPVKIKNDSPNPTILGDIGIIYQEAVPWSWSSDKNIMMPSKVVRLKVYAE